jgi:predicted outer membrane protein
LVAAVLLSADALSAQERQPDQPQPDRARANQQREGAAAGAQQVGGQREGRQGQMAQRVDQSVAVMLALGNYCEIQLGQLASQKSQNPQVKEFAQQMVQDHTQFLQQIQRFLPPGQFDDLQAGDGSAAGARPGRTGARTEGAAGVRPEGARPEGAAGARPDGAAAAPSEDRPATDQVAQNEAQRARENQGRAETRQAGQQGEQGRNPIWQIQKEAGQKALQTTKEILNEKQGADFDKCYIGGAVMEHVHMLAKLEAAQRHVSPEFQQIIRQGQQKTEQHLKHARTLDQQLAGAQPGQPGAARPGAAQPGAARPGAARPDAQPGAAPAAPRND